MNNGICENDNPAILGPACYERKINSARRVAVTESWKYS
jgi:hypothetical protein